MRKEQFGSSRGARRSWQKCASRDRPARGERLAAQTADVHAFLLADLHRVKTWRLAAHCVHAGGRNFDVLTIAEQTAKKPFRDWAAANITCADKEDAFHVSDGASERHPNLELNMLKSISAMVRSLLIQRIGASRQRELQLFWWAFRCFCSK